MQDPQDPETQYGIRSVEIDRAEFDRPQLRWLSVDDPEQAFALEENDYVLDSHYHQEFDAWEVLIRLAPGEDDGE